MAARCQFFRMVCLSSKCIWGFVQHAGNAGGEILRRFNELLCDLSVCNKYSWYIELSKLSWTLAIIGKQKSVYWECWLVEAQITWDQILCRYNDWDLSLCKKYSWYQPEKLNSVEYIMYNTCNIGQAEISVPVMLITCQLNNSGILANLCNKITMAPTKQSKIMIMVLGPIIVFIK